MSTWIIVLLILGIVLAGTAAFALLRLLKMKEFELKRGGNVELKVQALKIIMPLKVQAYERLLLYLERVQLPVLVKRVYVPGMEKNLFHLELLQNVREEFEHNLAQQLYVSANTWNAVKNAKEELVNQINGTFEQLNDVADVAILAQALVALPNPVVEQAVLVLKNDFERLL
ncbi:MAG: hypothetical protein HUK16_05950 [Bacteroidales bacterium]|nr:hypothetical protein [Bacteroidales bacterium]